ncbi:XRE family transcriptional regulator [Cronobacter sakazakii]|uniref:helix-turn-helix domain-containing protein n=1 Tax=Cronobacter sakazakii TaxID=28141 RepID=UPI00029C0A00|nr:helix-turn-helix transcriptional regulator [Cronobacter sakazakii]MDK1221440.1 helix-turn-helix transcriptional regulator [Cronobacter turicensis]CCK04073.1 transcriptional regulator, XRE family [Cronobacter sakazakii 701]EGT0042643.1 XRE family transcriptional regulator [Cronobacter sakazakii]EGT4239608.1 XRE family transcriptional regulator [Cronobacter sakazakii]EGT4259222.1 XRE family transcriptional regulator [Cronobacter sakazakii]
MTADIERSNGNVYDDLGLIDAEEMELKAQLAMAISDILKARGLTQQEAARLLGMTQPKLSLLLRGQFRGISETKMMACLMLLGRDISIVVGEAQQARGKMRLIYQPA